MKWIYFCLALSFMGCANNTSKKYENDPHGKCDDIFCLSIAVAKILSNSQFKKCSDMSGDQKKSCDTQVEPLKKHISDAS